VRCERLLHVEGLTVTLRWRTAIQALFFCFGFCQKSKIVARVELSLTLDSTGSLYKELLTDNVLQI
jgi:hypothetical protein